MLFNAEYKIRIVSLPGYKEQDKSSTSIQIETPGKYLLQKLQKLQNDFQHFGCACQLYVAINTLV